MRGSRIAVNRRAAFEYHLLEAFEAGIVLVGSEVKSLRVHSADMKSSYVSCKGNGEIFINNLHIPEYKESKFKKYDSRCQRKLLLHKKEIFNIIGQLKNIGITMIPTHMYFNSRGYVKISISIAKGKKLYDKREDLKRKDWEREKQRINKNDL